MQTQAHEDHTDNFLQDAILYLSDARGIYIPRDFAECTYRECVWNVTDEDWAILLQGPDAEGYWDTWDDVLSRALVVEPETHAQYTLWQDGDLWLVPRQD